MSGEYRGHQWGKDRTTGTFAKNPVHSHHSNKANTSNLMTPTMTSTEAKAAGLRCFWGESREQWMIDNVVADMVRGGITHALVEHADGWQVWRSSKVYRQGGKNK